MTLKQAFTTIRNLIATDDAVCIEASMWSHSHDDEITVGWNVCVIAGPDRKAKRFDATTLDDAVSLAVDWINRDLPARTDGTLADVEAQVASVA